MSDLTSRPSIAPYMYISRDQVKTLADGRKYRLIIYGAYNALGLIGTEKNGIAVLDEQAMLILCDGIAPARSGYDTPHPEQLAVFNNLLLLNDADFCDYVNGCERSRFKI